MPQKSRSPKPATEAIASPSPSSSLEPQSSPLLQPATPPLSAAVEADDQQADRQVIVHCLLILTMIAVGAAMYWLKPVLLPLVLAVLLTYCLTPVIDFQMHHLRLPRGPALLSTGILGLLILGLAGFLAAALVTKLGENIEKYAAEMHRLAERISETIPLERLGIKSDPKHTFVTFPEDLGRWAFSALLNEGSAIISQAGLVVVFMIFLLLGKQTRVHRATGFWVEIEHRIKGYLLRLVLFSAVTGFLVGLVLSILGVDLAWVFGLLAFLLNFIPNVGSLIAILLPVPVILLSPELSVPAKVLAIALPAAIQFGIGIVQPKILGNALELHPVTVLIGLIFFGMIWGVTGAFLATPLVAVIKIVLEHACPPLGR